MAEETPNPGTAPVTPQEQTPAKTFTQAEVDGIVQGRVAKYADYQELKDKASELETTKSELNTLKTYKTDSEGRMEGFLKELLATVPEDKHGLIPNEYNTLAKIDYIQKNKSFFEANAVSPTVTPTVATPTPPVIPAKETQEQVTNTNFGGYSSLAEWAMKDVGTYLTAKKEGKI